jgi:glycosyltransferase involved in cell wall biosynthesis
MNSIELVITTYNNPTALNLTLEAMYYQSYKNFDICIADDGSSSDTTLVIEKWMMKFQNKLRHEWIPDNGFNKNQILNNAIRSSKAEYMIFIDGDCIASPQFVQRHVELRRPNMYVSGGVIRLSKSSSENITSSMIADGQIFLKKLLKENNCLTSLGNYLKAGLLPLNISNTLELISPVKKTWNGGNSSTWRKHILSVNGFDETLKYGAEDIEMGYRLSNFGVLARSIRYSAPLLHLEHARSYANNAIVKNNKLYARRIKNTDCIWTENGIQRNAQ